MTTKSLSIARALTGLALAIATTTAGDATADSTDLNEASRAVFKEAVQAASKKEWAVCRTKAAGVWDQVKNPTVAALLGACEAELGMHRDAAEHLDYFLQRDTGAEPVQTKVARENFDRVRPNVVLVTVGATENASEVWVAGTKVGSTPARLFFAPGTHTIEVRKAGFETIVETVTGAGGEEKPFTASMKPLGAGGGGQGGEGEQEIGRAHVLNSSH